MICERTFFTAASERTSFESSRPPARSASGFWTTSLLRRKVCSVPSTNQSIVSVSASAVAVMEYERMDKLPTPDKKRRNISKTDVVVVGTFLAVLAVIGIVAVTSSGEARRTRRRISPVGMTLHPLAAPASATGSRAPEGDVDYSERGGNWSSQQWTQGCLAATRALLAKMNDTSNFNDWKIPRK